MASAWRNFKNRPLFTITFRPKIVTLDTDSILKVKTMVVWQPYSVLKVTKLQKAFLFSSTNKKTLHEITVRKIFPSKSKAPTYFNSCQYHFELY